MSVPTSRPVLLRPDNFTPPSRTPWGGRRLVETYKKDVLREDRARALEVVGECWEISVEPDFPSTTDEGRPLDALIRTSPVEYLGRAHAERAASTELLVKLVDAAQDLSVQIHPDDRYPGLAASESGKPECWYIVDRSPSCGLYLGLADGVDKGRMRRALESGADVSAMMVFVPVEPGDFFVIEPGTPHAIGRGVTLVEPQRVMPGKRGVTYRYWDWNRRYDAQGNVSADGAPRALHVDHALAVTDWNLPRGPSIVSRIRHRAGAPKLDGTARLDRLCGRDGPVKSRDFEVARITGTGKLVLEPAGKLRGLTVVSGTARLYYDDGVLVVRGGRSAVLPASIGRLELELERCHAVLSAIA
ncbi:MAG: type I phosphomannose isomerase catalytic subunit [Polyangiales bacterium]